MAPARSGLLAVRTDDALSGVRSRFMDGNELAKATAKAAVKKAGKDAAEEAGERAARQAAKEAAEVEARHAAEAEAKRAAEAEARRAAEIKAAERAELTAEQARNLKRFEDKIPAGAGGTSIRNLPGNGKAFQAEVPGRVPGSKAIYEKQVGSTGETLQYTKTTVDPAGKIVHVKDKILGTTVTP